MSVKTYKLTVTTKDGIIVASNIIVSSLNYLWEESFKVDVEEMKCDIEKVEK